MSDRLLPGQQLNVNDQLVSPNGKATLVMQGDGNLVLYGTGSSGIGSGGALWSTNTWGQPVTHAILQTDGNFVCYDAAGKAYWASNTNHGQLPYVASHSVVLQDDGNLIIYDIISGAVLWTSNTFQSWGVDCLFADQQLKINDSVTSLNGRATLIMQSDGNLVIYRVGDGALWSTNTWGKPVTHAIMQEDGNLVCYDDAGAAYWSSNTWDSNAAYARLLDEGALVLCDPTGHVLWSSDQALVNASAQCQVDRGTGTGVEVLSNQAFTTWPQNIQFNAPLYFKPKTRSEIVNAILQAEGHHHHVRAVGSAWSFSDAISATDDSPVIPGAMIDMSQLTASLQTGLWQLLASGVDETFLFHVRGGITISDLNLLLDQRAGGQALPSGGGRGQTLAGFISTGSHGGDSLVPPLADFVCAIHLVGAGGIEHWIEPDTGITDPAKLQQVFPCLAAGNIHYNTALFNAALVSGGSMGVIYSVILRTVPQFGLVQHQVVSTWEFVSGTGTNLSGVLDGSFMAGAYKLVNLLNGSPMPPPLAPFAGNMFSLVVINPYSLDPNDATLSGTPLSIYHGQHVCWVTNRVRVPVPAPASSSGAGLDFAQVVHAARNSLGFNVDYDIRFSNFANSVAGISDISTQAGMLIDFLAQFDARAVSAAITNVYTQLLPVGDSINVSHLLSTGVAFGTSIKSLSVEAAFAVPDGLDYISKVFSLVAAYASRNPRIYIGGYLSVRLVGQRTAALMGMQRWSPTCCVEYTMISGSNGVGEFVQDLQKLALSCHGALHWGQCNDVMTSADLQNIYGATSVQSFIQSRAVLSANGLLTTFNNSFTDRLGISV